MDSYEATRVVYSRIKDLDPENASKIMGLILIQDHGEKEMIRLAFGPESLVHSVIVKARKDLGLSSSNTPTSPSSPMPFSRHKSTNSRFLNGRSIPSPLSIPNPFSSLSDLNSNGRASPHNDETSSLLESLDHHLPENLFSSPKAAREYMSAFSTDTNVEDNGNGTAFSAPTSANNVMASSLLPATSALDIASLKSCYFQGSQDCFESWSH